MSIISCLLNISFLKCSLSASCIFSSILVYLLHLTIGLACDSKVIAQCKDIHFKLYCERMWASQVA